MNGHSVGPSVYRSEAGALVIIRADWGAFPGHLSATGALILGSAIGSAPSRQCPALSSVGCTGERESASDAACGPFPHGRGDMTSDLGALAVTLTSTPPKDQKIGPAREQHPHIKQTQRANHSSPSRSLRRPSP